MTSQNKELEAQDNILQLLDAEMQELRKTAEDYDLTKQRRSNVKESFNLIDNKELKKNPIRFHARQYFLEIIEQSHELFVLSALAPGKGLLLTFGRAKDPLLASKALYWFEDELKKGPLPRTLRALKIYFFDNRRK
jgi:hypothetical protein